MKILVISDTHGREENLEKVLKKIGMPDLVLHLGDSEGGEEFIKGMIDCPLHLVAGNCDFFCSYPKTKVVEAAGSRIFMTHGHYHFVNMGTRDLVEAARANGCNLAVFGHTHKPFLDESDPEVTVLNPGSLSQPRQEGRRPSYALVEVEEWQKVKCSLQFL